MSGLALAAVATEIAEQHQLARALAGEVKDRMLRAVEHARHAGMLLLKVKAELPHGDFRPWLTANVSFTARTAQRYMNAAAPTPKSDRLSHSQGRPNKSKRALAMLATLDRVQHRETVLAHAVLVSAELPETKDLRPDDIATLTALRDRLNTVLEATW